MTKRDQAIEAAYKKIRPLAKEKGAFWDTEIRSLYPSQGGLYAARKIAEKMGFTEHEIRMPQSNVIHNLFACDRATAERELLSCIHTIIAWGTKEDNDNE